MVTNWDACDVGSLEEVFRSHEFGRATGATGGRRAADSARRGDRLFGKRFGRPLTAVPSRDVEGEARARALAGREDRTARVEETEVPEEPPTCRALGSRCGAGIRSTPRRHRRHRRNDTPLGTGRSPLSSRSARSSPPGSWRERVTIRGPSVSAQGTHNTAPAAERHFQAPGAVSPGSAAPSGSLTAAPGSGGPSSRTAAHNGLGSGNAPGGQVTLVGPATYTGTPAPPAASGSSPAGRRQRGHEFSGASRQHQSRRPRRAHRREHGERRRVVSRDRRGQLGSSVPAAASTVGVVNAVVNTLDQAVSASTQ